MGWPPIRHGSEGRGDSKTKERIGEQEMKYLKLFLIKIGFIHDIDKMFHVELAEIIANRDERVRRGYMKLKGVAWNT